MKITQQQYDICKSYLEDKRSIRLCDLHVVYQAYFNEFQSIFNALGKEASDETLRVNFCEFMLEQDILNPRKTMEEWDEVGAIFDDYAKPGDLIDRPIYDYFLGVMPPAMFVQVGKIERFLMGEPMYHDSKTGEAVFMSFSANKDNCRFVGYETVDQMKRYLNSGKPGSWYAKKEEV